MLVNALYQIVRAPQGRLGTAAEKATRPWNEESILHAAWYLARASKNRELVDAACTMTLRMSRGKLLEIPTLPSTATPRGVAPRAEARGSFSGRDARSRPRRSSTATSGASPGGPSGHVTAMADPRKVRPNPNEAERLRAVRHRGHQAADRRSVGRPDDLGNAERRGDDGVPRRDPHPRGDFKRAVGGYVEAVAFPLAGSEATTLAERRREARRRAWAYWKADVLCPLACGDWTAGDVLFTGGVGPGGETLALSDAQLAELRHVDRDVHVLLLDVRGARNNRLMSRSC